MVLGIAGAAAAYQPQGGPAPRGDFRRGPELSREDRAHFEAMRKVRAELRDELRKEKPGKAGQAARAHAFREGARPSSGVPREGLPQLHREPRPQQGALRMDRPPRQAHGLRQRRVGEVHRRAEQG